MLVCTLGDALLDVIVRLDGPITSDTDTWGRTHVGPGGQAANVAAWAAELGGRGRLLCARARDAAARIVGEELDAHRVEVVGPALDGSTGTVISLATPDGRRTMLTDRGVSTRFAPEMLDTAWLEGCDRLHLAGYSLTHSPLRETALAAARLGPPVSIDASSTAAIEEAGVETFARTVAELGAEVVFANEAEAALLGPVDARTFVVKRGARGCVVRSASGEREYPAVPAQVVDSTGAGDAFAAGFLLGGPELGLEAAARCVARMGAMP